MLTTEAERRREKMGLVHSGAGGGASRRGAAVDRGFTLIEMLVVIAIIGILAGVTIVGYGAVMNDMRIQKARSECALLGAAGSMYHALLHRWPDPGDGSSQVDIITYLTDPIETDDLGRPPALEVVKESQLNAGGEFIDPWGTPYTFEFPNGFLVHSLRVYSADPVLSFRVFSWGPDVDLDYGHFEGDGCPAADHSSLTEPIDDVRP